MTLGWSRNLVETQWSHHQNWDNVWHLTKADGWMRRSLEVTSRNKIWVSGSNKRQRTFPKSLDYGVWSSTCSANLIMSPTQATLSKGGIPFCQQYEWKGYKADDGKEKMTMRSEGWSMVTWTKCALDQEKDNQLRNYKNFKQAWKAIWPTITWENAQLY